MKIATSELEHLREEVNNCHRIIKDLQKKREFVGLTDEEMEEVRKQAVDLFVQEVKTTGKGRNEPIKFGRLVEAKLKEKNT